MRSTQIPQGRAAPNPCHKTGAREQLQCCAPTLAKTAKHLNEHFIACILFNSLSASKHHHFMWLCFRWLINSSQWLIFVGVDPADFAVRKSLGRENFLTWVMWWETATQPKWEAAACTKSCRPGPKSPLSFCCPFSRNTHPNTFDPSPHGEDQAQRSTCCLMTLHKGWQLSVPQKGSFCGVTQSKMEEPSRAQWIFMQENHLQSSFPIFFFHYYLSLHRDGRNRQLPL